MVNEDIARSGRSPQEDHEPISVKLQIMSDLHLETPAIRPMYSEFQLVRKSPYLALLGDIGKVHDGRLFEFLGEQLRKFEIVFYLMGNHEPWQVDFGLGDQEHDFTYQAAVSKLEEFEAATRDRRQGGTGDNDASSNGQFVFLNRKRFDLSETITLLGCTLFSNISESQQSTISLFVSDFCNIQNWTVDDHNSAHRADLDWLNCEVEAISSNEPGRTIVIMTHHSPSSLLEANDPEHLEDSRGVQSAFVTDLQNESCWNSRSVRLWAFGHTHYNCDFVDPKTGMRVLSNQRGYGREDAFDFDAEKVVTVSGARLRPEKKEN